MTEENGKTEIQESGISSIKLTKNAKNQYSWDIKVYGNVIGDIFDDVEKTNKMMLETYGFVEKKDEEV